MGKRCCAFSKSSMKKEVHLDIHCPLNAEKQHKLFQTSLVGLTFGNQNLGRRSQDKDTIQHAHGDMVNP